MTAQRARRWLYVGHRWLGIVTCLFFAVWFLSGLVMLYVPFPAFGKAERLVGLERIDWGRVQVDARQALGRAGITTPPRILALEMRDGDPVWRIESWEGVRIAIAATTGARIGGADEPAARRIAASFGSSPVLRAASLMRDQWTVAGGYDADRPLWKLDLAGQGARTLYISSRTGAVVLDTNGRERFWNWVGSVPHWIYPTLLRQHNGVWRQVVMWVAGPCVIGAITGMWIGILRIRTGRRRYRDGRVTPYRGWMKWHHISGLVGGIFLTTWIFSGWLSVDPFRLFASPGISTASRMRYAAAGMPPPIALERVGAMAGDTRRVELRWVAGQALLVLMRPGQVDQILDPGTLAPVTIAVNVISRAAARLVPDGQIVAIDRLMAPDAYWYDVGGIPALPVLRLRFNDPARSWVHIDPASGAMLGDTETRRRSYRWAFDLLHRWDLNLLTGNRPARDMVLWALSLLGLVTSISGIRIGWVRLRR